jgi:hypothetical protein
MSINLGLHVKVCYPNGRTREIRIDGISPRTASNHMIDVLPPRNAPKGTRPERVSVKDYFKGKYEKSLE